MAITVKAFLDNTIPKNERELAELSDRLWKIGTLEKIKEKVCPELFTIHIGCNVIGNWRCEGWHGIISDHADLIPYIPDTLDELDMPEVKNAFQKVIAVFPSFVQFSNEDSSYYDAINFLQNTRFKVSDERLNSFTKEEREHLVKKYRGALDKLEELSDPLWGPSEGWEVMYCYIRDHCNA